MAEKNIEFDRNILISGKIICKTGLHIGGRKEELEIGAIDQPVIIDPMTRKPVIPGSSLKGKIRSSIELRDKKYSSDGSPHAHGEKCKDPECKICTIFGSSEDVGRGPTRLIVRDAFAKEEPEIEIKAENVIDRLTGKSEIGPRFLERVPAGSEFDLDMIYGIYGERDLDNMKMVFEGMEQVEDSYLGGSGSRGYGKIEFSDIQFKVKKKEQYINGLEKKLKPVKIEIDGREKESFSVNEILLHFDELKEKLAR